MAFVQYLVFDGAALPLPDSYDLSLSSVEADSGGETEAGTVQRDVVRAGVVSISVTFSVSPAWLKKLSGYSKQEKIVVDFLIRRCWSIGGRKCMWTVFRRSWKGILRLRGCGRFRLCCGSFENGL